MIPVSTLQGERPPFTGSGTTGIAARQLGRQFTGIELHAPFIRLAGTRIREAGAASGGMR